MVKKIAASVRKMTKPVVKKTAIETRAKNTRPVRALTIRNANHQDRRTFIMTTAAKLFSEKGYQVTTMDEISAMTKINKSTIYYYYKSKAEILLEICMTTAIVGQKMIMPATKMNSAIDGIKLIIDVMVKWVIQDQVFARVYFQEERFFKSIFGNAKYKLLREQQKQTSNIIDQEIIRGCATGEFKPRKAMYTGRFIMGVVWGIYRFREPDIDIDDTIARATEFVLTGMQL